MLKTKSTAERLKEGNACAHPIKQKAHAGPRHMEKTHEARRGEQHKDTPKSMGGHDDGVRVREHMRGRRK